MHQLKKHLSEEQIAQCADLLQERREIPTNLQQHLDVCSSCKYELMSVMELSSSNIKVISFRARKGWMLGAAALILILVGTALYFNLQEKKTVEAPQMVQQQSIKLENQTETEEKQQAIPTDTMDVAVQSDQLALFVPNPQFEQLVDRFKDQMRSDIKIRQIEMQVNSQQLKLTWQQSAPEDITFEVYDNSGILRKTLETKSPPLIIENLGLGLYYIKVMNADFDLLQCLKVKIE